MCASIGVLGGGVSGLSTALLLMEDGHDVTIYADRFTPETTSDVATALWFPWSMGSPEYLTEAAYERLGRWSRQSFSYFETLVGASCGVRPIVDHELFVDDPGEQWAFGLVELARTWKPQDVPAPFTVLLSFQTLFIETPIYLPWLHARCQQLGATMARRRFADVSEVESLAHDVVVNCLGLGSRDLVEGDAPADRRVGPVRGQLVLMAPDPAIDCAVGFDLGQRAYYILPRQDALLLGGTLEPDVFDTSPDPATGAAIVEANLSLARATFGALGLPEPRFTTSDEYRMIAGLRPVRPEGPRVEVGQIGKKPVIHNYGHGGGGITLSWGCAQEVVSLLTSL